MTAEATPSSRSSRNLRGDFPCPAPGCAYTMDSAGSVPAHVAMYHPEVPMDQVAPRRVLVDMAALPEPVHGPDCPEGLHAHVFHAADSTLAPAGPPSAGATLVDLPLELVDIGDNVRVEVEGLEEMAASIAAHGVLQPIKATGPHADGRYLVTWGQRRTLASRMAGKATIPAIVLPPDADVDRHGAARSIEQLVENLHRKDLPALDRARAMREVVDGGKSQADLARELGVDPSTIANSLRLLELDAEVQRSIEAGLITAAHGKALVGLAPSTQREIAKRAASEGASAHRTEELVADHKRQEEWRNKRAAEERANAEAARESQQRSIAGMAKKKVPTDAPIHVVGGYYGGNGAAGHVAKLIREAGYTNVVVADRSLPARPAGLCNCTDWRVEIGYGGGLTIAKSCSVRAHVEAKSRADESARLAQYALEARVTERVRQVAPNQAYVSPYAGEQLLMEERLARMLLWELFGYGVADWAAARGFKRNQPWQAIAALTLDELATEIAKKVGADFRDNYGYHVDWDQVAGWMGMAEPAEASS